MLEDISIFWRGLAIGMMIAAPVGPVGLLCIRRTIQKGLMVGFATGFGAAFADALFSAVAALGVAAITQLLQTYANPIQLFGGAFLLFLAWHTWHDKPRQPHPEEVERRYLRRFGPRLGGAARAMATSFVITLTNPATVLGVLAVVATFSGLQSRAEVGTIIAGIFAGSSLWWLMLSGGVSLLRGHFTETRVQLMNRVMGTVLAVIALGAMIAGVAGFLKA